VSRCAGLYEDRSLVRDAFASMGRKLPAKTTVETEPATTGRFVDAVSAPFRVSAPVWRLSPGCRSWEPGIDMVEEANQALTEGTMKYLLMIYVNPESRAVWEALSGPEQAVGIGAHDALVEELAASGELIVSEALADTSMAKRVSIREGRRISSDGPFGEVKELLAGFYLIECESLKRAVEIAERLPEASVGEIEVRPVMELGGAEM